MSFNYSKLRGKIIEKYGTQGQFAKALGISERTLSLKLNNRIFFSQNEISKILFLLGIENQKVIEYFFTQKVQQLEQSK